MTSKQILGISMVATPFLAIGFICLVYGGLEMFLGVFVTCAIFEVLVFCGVKLATGGKESKGKESDNDKVL